jgi:segregation and condensation protein A
VELENLNIWDLFDAFNRLLEQTGRREAVHTIGVDDTPITLHAEDILDSIERAGGTQTFEEVFTGRTRPEMIGLFLALLELIRQRRVRVSQDEPFGPILIHLLDRTPLSAADDLETQVAEEPDEIEGEESSVGTQAGETNRAPVGALLDREGILDTEREEPPVHVPPDVPVGDAHQGEPNDDSQ